jgi:hypothetical protein
MKRREGRGNRRSEKKKRQKVRKGRKEKYM